MKSIAPKLLWLSEKQSDYQPVITKRLPIKERCDGCFEASRDVEQKCYTFENEVVVGDCGIKKTLTNKEGKKNK